MNYHGNPQTKQSNTQTLNKHKHHFTQKQTSTFTNNKHKLKQTNTEPTQYRPLEAQEATFGWSLLLLCVCLLLVCIVVACVCLCAWVLL